MSMLTIDVLNDDGLSGHVFSFYTNECGRFWLSEFTKIERPSKRHKFRYTILWSFWRGQRVPKPTIETEPALVTAIEQAEQQLRERIRYVEESYGK